MESVGAFVVALLFVPIWAYLSGLVLIVFLWILAFMGHFLGLGALFTSFHWWTVLRWGYAVTALELLLASAGASGSRGGIDPSVFTGIWVALVVSLVGIAVLRHRRNTRGSFV